MIAQKRRKPGLRCCGNGLTQFRGSEAREQRVKRREREGRFRSLAEPGDSLLKRCRRRRKHATQHTGQSIHRGVRGREADRRPLPPQTRTRETASTFRAGA